MLIRSLLRLDEGEEESIQNFVFTRAWRDSERDRNHTVEARLKSSHSRVKESFRRRSRADDEAHARARRASESHVCYQRADNAEPKTPPVTQAQTMIRE